MKVFRLVSRQHSASMVLNKSNFAAVFAHINSNKVSVFVLKNSIISTFENENFYTWLSEFMDLILVATIVKVAQHLK